MSRPRLWIRLLLFGLCVVLVGIAMFPVYAVVVMSLSRAPGFSVVVSPTFSTLTLDHFIRFLSHTDSEGSWLFGRHGCRGNGGGC